MKRGRIILLGLFLILSSVFVLAQNTSVKSVPENDCLYFFYGDYKEGCPDCEAALNYLDELKTKYPELKTERFEVYYNHKNWWQMEDYFQAYGVPEGKQGVPVVFLGGRYLIGGESIKGFLESAILSNKGKDCPSLEKKEVIGVSGESSPKFLIESLTWGIMSWGAFKESLKPAALGMLIILVGLLLLVKERKKALKRGLIFTAIVYLAYFLLGMGWFWAGGSYYFYKVVGLLGAVAGLFYIGYYFRREKPFLIKVPFKWKQRGEILQKLALSPWGMIIVGGLASLGGLAFGKEKPYLVMSALLEETATRRAVMPLLLYYDLIFILPLLIATLIIFFGTEKIEEKEVLFKEGGIRSWRQRNLRRVRLGGGIFLLALGLMLLIYF